MIAREIFAEHVRDALENYYDAARLQSSPLLDLPQLAVSPGQPPVAALRQALRETIESLRPPSSFSFGRPECLGYRLLWLRYIQSRNQPAICDELALSRTSYYRHLSEALDAVVAVLWDRCTRHAPLSEASPQEDAVLSREAIERVGQLARESQRRMVGLAGILEHVWEVIAPMQARLGITVRLAAPPTLPNVYCDPAILRQILLSLLTEAMGLAGPGGLDLIVTPREQEIGWCLSGLDARRTAGQEIDQSGGLAVSRTLLCAYGGRLWSEGQAPGTTSLCFTLPLPPPRTILIVDDDPDAGDLYRRYLQTEPYILRVAHSAAEMEQVLAASQPDLILLDVIMPQEDGWDILQRLKTRPETAHIPVLVCSVLSQPVLALMLGATQVLQKPFAPPTLVRALREALPQGDNPG